MCICICILFQLVVLFSFRIKLNRSLIPYPDMKDPRETLALTCADLSFKKNKIISGCTTNEWDGEKSREMMRERNLQYPDIKPAVCDNICEFSSDAYVYV